MSLGFKGEQNRFLSKTSSQAPKTSKIIDPEPIKVVTTTSTSTVLRLPGFGTCLYNTVYVLLISAGVAALWISAIGMMWIQYYIECNQGIKDCPELIM
tara:strand:+ start:480 stop:773 length:294 start_codon:yes stop_codon:yes gene_type:complete